MTLFDLVARLTLDSSEYEKALGDSENKTKNFASKIGGSLVTGAKALGAATVAAGAAIGKVVYDSVNAYSEYEQLVGGVQKLFGESADQVRRYAEDAYKTSGLSASQYMEQATSFSAALINSLDGDTARAAELTDVAMRAISDNFNTFGGDISSIQSAFQGFAKQNYTMLDNLKLGYGGTKTEMERLISDANEYAKSIGEAGDLSIESFADIVQAIELVQEKQHIAGTTANEAATTIQGALGMTKAAWQNLITGLSDSEADVNQLVSNLITSAGAVAKNIIPTIKQALSGIGTAVAELAPALADGITGLITDVLPDLLRAAVQLVSSLGQSLVDNADAIIEAAFEIINVLVESLSDPNGLITLIDAAFEIVKKLADGLSENLPTLIPAIVSIITQIAERLLDPDNLIMLVDSAIAILIALADGLISSMDILLEKAPEIIAGFVSAIVQAAPRLFDAALAIVGKLGEGIRNYYRLLWDVGKNIVSGIWQGITNSLDWIKGKIKGWVGNVMSFIKGLFGIHSPSKWAENIIGKNLVLGMAEGILENEDAVSDALNDLTNGVSADAILNMGASIPSMSDGTITEDYLISDDRTADGTMSQILSLLNYYLPTMASMKVMLDSGALVGELAPGMDAALGIRSVYAARGMA